MTKSPGVPQARHLAERSVAPYLRSDLHALGRDHALTVDRLSELELKVEQLFGGVAVIETHQPAILNAISSTNGTTRLLARETTELRDLIAGAEARSAELSSQMKIGDEAVREDLRPHIRTLGWLLERIETVRAEMMHELRYGRSTDAAAIETKIVNPEHLSDADIRLNLGAGHIAIDGFVNVDMRELPGIDVVAPVDALPFEPGTIAEIFSSHTVEHFPELQLRRHLLPYWSSLLRNGGTFRAVVPDLEAMTKAYAKGELTFEALRAVTYGGQEYEGDFHFNGFTPQSLSDVLVDCGFEQPRIIAQARPNGDCLEFEISAVKPSG